MLQTAFFNPAVEAAACSSEPGALLRDAGGAACRQGRDIFTSLKQRKKPLMAAIRYREQIFSFLFHDVTLFI